MFDERVVVQIILGFYMRGKDNSYSLDRDEEVSGSILHINGRKKKIFLSKIGTLGFQQ